ncbi:hypothetical protein RJD38_22175 (plasmid) [Vibrio scophthalmi]|jgi:hypothetical protein|uniref:hypothetical protein n=1 Tax=Vibrio scophthalmi TaxID=45658 RepID=UPI00349F31E0
MTKRSIGKTEEAKLSTVETASVAEEKTTFDMSLRNMPKALREKFKRLKYEGKVTGSMNDYMRRAFMEQLKRDDI